MKKIKIICAVFLGLLCFTVSANATSIIGGPLDTGISTGIAGIVIAAPTASVPSGTYTSAQSVSLAAIGSLSVYYTIDGTAPTCSAGNIYSAPIAISSTSTLKAIACYGNNITSSVSSFAYVINLSQSPTPPAGGGGGSTTSSSSYETGDINKDKKVDKYDFALIMANWGKTGSNDSDLNGDNKVDKYDFALLMVNWGT